MSPSKHAEKKAPAKTKAPENKVYRFPVYRRPAPEPAPAPAPPPVEEAPKEETPAPPPPPVWSEWQYIKCDLWEGYWRASAQEDGGWLYHLTQDGKTIWEQKVAKPEAPAASTASAKTAGEPPAATAKPTPPPALKQPAPPPAAPVPVVVASSAKTVISAPETASSAKTNITVPSYTVKKPEPPKPPAAPPTKAPAGTITLHTKQGKAVTVPLPDSLRPMVIRTLLEKHD